jgi:hypothetical protein
MLDEPIKWLTAARNGTAINSNEQPPASLQKTNFNTLNEFSSILIPIPF